jgi:peptide/nickel transport system permease protein
MTDVAAPSTHPDEMLGGEHARDEPRDLVAPARRMGVIGWLSAGWLGAVVVAAVFAPVLPIDDPLRSDFRAIAVPPSADNLLGTDANGRDLLSRTIYGARISLVVAAGSTAIGVVVGGLLGTIAGYRRGAIDRVVSVTVDAMLAFPALVLALVVTTYLGATVTNLTVVIGVIAIPAYARISRSATLSFAQRDFVHAAEGAGASTARVFAIELAPNVALPVSAFALIGASTAIVVEASLGFLGFGTQPPDPSWGNMISAGRTTLADSPHVTFVPSFALFATVLALNLLGDRLRELTDVKGTTL